MTSKRIESAEDLHFRVLQLLQHRPEMTQRELAQVLGVSNGKVHYCIRALIDTGLVKLENFAQSRHRLRYAYLLTPTGAATKALLATRFLKRKMTEYAALQAEIAALQSEIGHADSRSFTNKVN